MVHQWRPDTREHPVLVLPKFYGLVTSKHDNPYQRFQYTIADSTQYTDGQPHSLEKMNWEINISDRGGLMFKESL